MGSLCFFLFFSFVINVKFHMDILHSVIACFTLLVDSRSFDTTKWMIFVTNIDVKKKIFLKNSRYMSHNSLDKSEALVAFGAFHWWNSCWQCCLRETCFMKTLYPLSIWNFRHLIHYSATGVFSTTMWASSLFLTSMCCTMSQRHWIKYFFCLPQSFWHNFLCIKICFLNLTCLHIS